MGFICHTKCALKKAYVARFRMQLEDLRIVKCGLEEVVALEGGAQKQ